MHQDVYTRASNNRRRKHQPYVTNEGLKYVKRKSRAYQHYSEHMISSTITSTVRREMTPEKTLGVYNQIMKKTSQENARLTPSVFTIIISLEQQ